MSGGVRHVTDYQRATLDQRAALIEWVRQNGLDPARIIADGLRIDMDARTIRYQEYVDEDTPGGWQPGPNSARRREATAPLLVDPPPAMFGEPAPRYAPPESYDWEAYERTCDPDRQLDGLGDLDLFLGGSEGSFTGRLLALIAKAESTPANLAAIERGFPREVAAWRMWRAMTDRTPTAAELCAALVAHREAAEVRAELNRALGDHYAKLTGGAHE